MAILSSADTIVAPATASGEAGVAVLRISGPMAIAVLGRVFRPAGSVTAVELPDRRLVRGMLVEADVEDGGAASGTAQVIDDCLAVVMRAPRSFTGEDVAEVHCHGGRAVVAEALGALVAAGARLAEPGEFSRRAFLNGRMDLSQAEALADLISSRTRLARRAALRQLRGGLSERISAIRSSLLDVAALIEAHLDFPDEDIPVPVHDSIASRIEEGGAECRALLATFSRGRVVREGARVVLAGRPNAGKSSLFNALLGKDRALVSPHPGTTRDTLEATIDLGGLAVTLVDTAGLREAGDEVERMGIARAEDELRGADLVLQVIDGTRLTPEDVRSALSEYAAHYGEAGGSTVPRMLLNSKADTLSGADRLIARDITRSIAPDGMTVIPVSAQNRLGLDILEAEIAKVLLGDNSEAAEDEATVASARHADALREAEAALARAGGAFSGGLSGEFTMIDIREALGCLGSITGEQLDEQILDRVFSTFCLGK